MAIAMNLYFRFFYAVLTALFRSKIKSPLEATRRTFCVLPTDLDLNGHMNNGRYLTLMDIGRMDYAIRVGLAAYMFKNKFYPLTMGVTIRYRLPLMPFQKFEIVTRTICWGQKTIYMDQQFVIKGGSRDGVVAAVALIKIMYSDVKSKRTILCADILKALGMSDVQSPEIPAYIEKWTDTEDSIKEEMMQPQQAAAE